MNKVELIPAFNDNYVFLITNTAQMEAIVIDPGEAKEIIKILQQRNLKLAAVLMTHHHDDHIGGVSELIEHFPAPTYAPLKYKVQIPADYYAENGQELKISSFTIQAIDLPGHTLGHNAYWFVDQKWLFSGDVLFGLGCGRLFEGSFEQGFESLQRIKSLPDETQVFCAHEYTEINLNFSKTLPDYKTADFINYEQELKYKRNLGLASVPLTLSSEKKVNPFLLAKNVQEFTELRKLRNQF
ncbi:MAG: hydroxyacylglutathione hydrolase [Bdellovibrionota bacterium]